MIRSPLTNFRFALLIFCLGAFVSSAALAKPVKIEWKPLKGAKSYELAISSSGKKEQIFKLEKSKWKGDLAFAVYTYKIRAIDKVERPGKWSASMPLAVMPETPTIVGPESDTVVTYRNTDTLHFKWQRPEGLKKVRVRISNSGGREFLNRVMETDHYDLPAAEPGKYVITLHPVLEGRGLASLENKTWDGKEGTEKTITLEKKNLKAPDQTYPLGKMRPMRQFSFSWVPVEGAEGYEVQLFDKKSGTPMRKWNVSKSEATYPGDVDSIENREYKWSVRALASVENNGSAAILGPVSETEFKIDSYAERFDERGYVALSFLPTDFKYVSELNKKNEDGTFTPNDGFSPKSIAVNLRLGGEYFVTPSIALSGTIDYYTFKFENENMSNTQIDIGAKYRIPIVHGLNGFVLYPKIGFQHRTTFHLSGYADTVTKTETLDKINFAHYGPYVGFDLRQGFAPFSIAFKFNYYIPVDITSGDGKIEQLSDSARNYSNISLGLQGIYWIKTNYSVGLGAYYDKRQIAFDRTPASTTGSKGAVDETNTYIFMSLIYRFGD